MIKASQNIILVTVDSLRRDKLGCYGSKRGLTPNIDAFAGTCTLFDNAYSNGPNTPHAFPAILAARDALMAPELGLFHAPLTLAEVLSDAGYTCVGINAANPYLAGNLKYDRGFAEFYDFLSPGPGKTDHTPDNSNMSEIKSGIGKSFRSDVLTIPTRKLEEYVVTEENIRNKQQLEQNLPDFISKILQQLAPGPFFLWIHFMDTHYPYVPSKNAQQQIGVKPFSLRETIALNQRVRENMPLSPGLLKRTLELYEASIFQLDRQFGELVNELQKKNLFSQSTIFFLADHGEEFMEHGDLQHKCKLYEELIHVPLLIKLPNQRVKKRVHHLSSLLQIPSTVVSSVGLDSPFVYRNLNLDIAVSGRTPIVFAGASYLHQKMPPVDDHVFKINSLPKVFCCRTDSVKLIYDTQENQCTLFDLFEDPSETINLAEKRTDLVEKLKRPLFDYSAILEKMRIKARLENVRQYLQPNEIEGGTDVKAKETPEPFLR